MTLSLSLSLLPSLRPLPRSEGLGQRNVISQGVWPQTPLWANAGTRAEQSVSELNGNKCFSYKMTPVLCKFREKDLVTFGTCQMTLNALAKERLFPTPMLPFPLLQDPKGPD